MEKLSDNIIEKYKNQMLTYSQKILPKNEKSDELITVSAKSKTIPPTISTTISAPTPVSIQPPMETQPMGIIQVIVSTGRDAYPIPNALVTISRTANGNEELVKLSKTDISGETLEIPVPTLSKELTEQPGAAITYIPYNIRVDMPGFYTFYTSGVPVYEGITALQEVLLVPLPENYIGGAITKFPQSGPLDL